MSPKYPLLLVPSTGAAAVDVDTLHSGDCHSRSASPLALTAHCGESEYCVVCHILHSNAAIKSGS